MATQAHRSDFIRRVFAIVVSVGFAGAVANSDWVRERHLPEVEELGPLFCLLSGLILVIGSWEGYHKHADKTDDKSQFSLLILHWYFLTLFFYY